MQTTLPAGLPSRLAYYLSSMYSGQMREGDSYSTLAPSIGVCILNRTLLPNTTSFHTRFRMCSLEERLVLTDQLEIHIVELPKYNGTLNELPNARPMEQWAYFLMHAAEMTVADIGIFLPSPEFAEAGGVLNMISQTPEERLRYELRTKAMRDYTSNMEAARKEGLQTGFEEGRQEGAEQGTWMGRIQLLQELLGDSVSTSMELQAYEFDRLKSFAEALQVRLRDRK